MILQETGPIECITSDRGSEWINKKMKVFCAKNGIEIRHPYTSFHSPFVERVQLTLQVGHEVYLNIYLMKIKII